MRCSCVQSKLSQFVTSLAADHLAKLAEGSTQQQLTDAAQGIEL